MSSIVVFTNEGRQIPLLSLLFSPETKRKTYGQVGVILSVVHLNTPG